MGEGQYSALYQVFQYILITPIIFAELCVHHAHLSTLFQMGNEGVAGESVSPGATQIDSQG